MMWTLRAYPDWWRRETRTVWEENEIEETRESVTEAGGAER